MDQFALIGIDRGYVTNPVISVCQQHNLEVIGTINTQLSPIKTHWDPSVGTSVNTTGAPAAYFKVDRGAGAVSCFYRNGSKCHNCSIKFIVYDY